MDTTCPKCQQEIEGTRKGNMIIYTCQFCKRLRELEVEELKKFIRDFKLNI